ncbi:MAG: phosphomethylpyrimidine synthase ThiC [Deltaproteobacteria bacterium]|nr:phosphomethylpyrimidine synthase ThiC [Deltaproteobacteria bacterium]
MTQLEAAREGKITAEMEQAAEYEGMNPEAIRDKVAAGSVVIPKNRGHRFSARAIGRGLSTKINANIGTSASHANLTEELEKLQVAVEAGADAVMDLSTGGDIDAILAGMVAHSPVMIGTVPIYRSISRLFAAGKDCGELDAESLFVDIEQEAKAGVDFITVHCGITTQTLSILEGCGRIMGVVSRGGSLMAEWIKRRGEENPLFAQYDRLLSIARTYDVTLSLGDGLRPGTICDAEDRAQVGELIVLGQLVERARKAGVQVMVEGPGHVPLRRIAADMQLQKRLCSDAPYYVLGPLPTDIAPGYDHIVGAIGGAIAAAAGADFLCYVTPAEHLGLPTGEDVREGVMASRVAAHIGDLEKGVKGAWERNVAMSEARRRFDWEGMFGLCLDPVKARSVRSRTEDKDKDVCTMCGEMCAIKTYNRFLESGSGKE